MDTYTFPDIFKKDIFVNDDRIPVHGIVIPRIQRDYAQGREANKETIIRNRFLEEIFRVIAAGEETTMEMDFVYGSIRKLQNGKSSENRFIPLDGQQRLTTLYLLYWYVGNRELQCRELEALRKLLLNFSYEIRPSSSKFCEKLSEITLAFAKPPGKEIRNASWFFDAFNHDPTIKSMLTMLDAIHEKYTATGKALYSNLSRLRFYILPLDGFNLTDDLYIKMNARGKQLTDFEAFKADLTSYITEAGNPESDYYAVETLYDSRPMPRHLAFSIKLDNVWTNFFWSYSQKHETLEEQSDEDRPIDQFFMNFIIRYFFNLFIVQDSLPFERLREKKLYSLYGKDGDDHTVNYQPLDYYKDILSRPGILKNMECVLDCLSAYYKDIIKNEAKAPWEDGGFSEDWDFFDPQINLSKRVVFLGITLFIEKNNTIDSELDRVQFARWMRVVRNIVENAGIDSAEAMTGIMRLINELSSHSGDIYAFLAGNSSLKSNAAKEQVIEEREKAELILTDKTGQFEREIIDAENHRFFRGQIYFLLHISGGDMKQFIYYRDRAKSVFTSGIEKFPCRFHRVLAVLVYKHPLNDCDYYAEDSSADRLYYFEDEDAVRSYMLRHNENDFYYKLIKMLLDTAASKSEFDQIIQDTPFDEKIWQTYFISSPHCFDYCQQKLIAWRSEDEIYLLKHSQMNHHHAELRTYYLYKEWIEEAYKKETFLPFTTCKYFDPANSSERPYAYLDEFIYHDFTYALDILYLPSAYELRFFSRDSDEKASNLLKEINNRAVLNMEFKKRSEDYDGGQLVSSGYKTMADVKKRIIEICDSLKRLNLE
jgi:hypothetical protein